ncbi:hypothetical protein GCM10023084_30040 [Streptomyces lacrimifluminis]|uniref:Uncharacterized protein n=1 Tax=Streptomyces lacrimifluminis TaxID=1500077 RepID=A0A917NU82_9ACTN|nr:hypothetical protein GCM10012282_26660 [Streptomyces lacrimifluminis]
MRKRNLWGPQWLQCVVDLDSGGLEARAPEPSLEWVIRFTLDERWSVARGGLGSIKHRPGRGNNAIP